MRSEVHTLYMHRSHISRLCLFERFLVASSHTSGNESHVLPNAFVAMYIRFLVATFPVFLYSDKSEMWEECDDI